ncbi:hypothetical protein SBI_00932 [Streptomyces bingchenggensis BCW-1]|uniref:Uncharacterized protein n=1 Tax=Streptomyces bingchenggensis (strain BCW-1) TaxID=749414 RepID=D7C665_STRBB|nr:MULTISPECIES: hypothetical protein [Streptomyces]ADI04053.1 hypothetical protein SBI_00932 [Streptomyces bingchenggensis BCW-1]
MARDWSLHAHAPPSRQRVQQATAARDLTDIIINDSGMLGTNVSQGLVEEADKDRLAGATEQQVGIGALLAGALVALLPSPFVYLAFQRTFLTGIAAGAVKG